MSNTATRTKNPYAPFMPVILKEFQRVITYLIDQHQPNSVAELLVIYRKHLDSNISDQKFREWYKEAGFGVVRGATTIVRPKNAEATPPTPKPSQAQSAAAYDHDHDVPDDWQPQPSNDFSI